MSPPRPTTLTELIDHASRVRGTTSTHQLAKLAREAGHRISHTTIAEIRKGSYPSAPNGDTLAALAFLAAVPETTARKLAGLPVSGVPFARQLPPEVDLLRADQRNAVLRVIRLFVDAEKRAAAIDTTQSVELADTPGRVSLRDEDDPLLHPDHPHEEEGHK